MPQLTGVCEINAPYITRFRLLPQPLIPMTMLKNLEYCHGRACEKTPILAHIRRRPAINIVSRGIRGERQAIAPKLMRGRLFRKHRTKHLIVVCFLTDAWELVSPRKQNSNSAILNALAESRQPAARRKYRVVCNSPMVNNLPVFHCKCAVRLPVRMSQWHGARRAWRHKGTEP